MLHGIIRHEGAALSYQEVIQLWQLDEGFRQFFNETLAGLPFKAYRWETPPLTADTVSRSFEFVALDCPGLDRAPDANAFADQFLAASAAPGVVSFPNMRNDAVLVVPAPSGDPGTYVHLAQFMRQGPDQQKHALWQVVGQALEGRIGSRPVWLSTAGMGVSWLHVRLDSRPKYYGYRPYREAS